MWLGFRSLFSAEAVMSVVPNGVPVIDTRKTRAPGAGPSLLYAGHLLKRNNVQSIVESLPVLVHRGVCTVSP
jgi:hypothetical protein